MWPDPEGRTSQEPWRAVLQPQSVFRAVGGALGTGSLCSSKSSLWGLRCHPQAHHELPTLLSCLRTLGMRIKTQAHPGSMSETNTRAPLGTLRPQERMFSSGKNFECWSGRACRSHCASPLWSLGSALDGAVLLHVTGPVLVHWHPFSFTSASS